MLADDQFGRDLGRRVSDMFAAFVGPQKRFTYAELAAASGVSKSSLGDYAAGVQMPLHVALRLIPVLPLEAANMLLRQSGYRLAPIEPDEDDWHGLGAEASMLTFEIFEAEKDGIINHSEKARLRKRARSLIAKAEGLAE